MCMSRVEKWFVNSARRRRSRRAQARRLLSHTQVKAADAYLEVGCGNGAVTASAAADFGLKVTGVDVDVAQVELAQNAFGSTSARFVVADAAHLPFGDASFDIVLSFMVTHHIRQLSLALQEIRRVLKPGGYFVYADVSLPSIVASISGIAGHGYHLPRSSVMRGALERCGFVEVHASRHATQFYGPFEAVYVRGRRS